MNSDPSGVFDTDRTGKVKDKDPAATQVGDKEVGKAIGELDKSIERRKQENSRFPRGNPNGSPEERRQHQRYKDHAERISREEAARERLRRRLEEIERRNQ